MSDTQTTITLSVKDQYQLRAEISNFLTHKSPQYVKYHLSILRSQLNKVVNAFTKANDDLVKELGNESGMIMQFLPDKTPNPNYLKYREEMEIIEKEMNTYKFKKLPLSIIGSDNTEDYYELLYKHCFYMDKTALAWFDKVIADNEPVAEEVEETAEEVVS